MLTADDRQAKAGVGVEGVVNGALVQVMAPTKLPQDALSEDALAQIHALESAGEDGGCGDSGTATNWCYCIK